MRQIVITGTRGSVTLMKDLVFTIQNEPIEKKVEMASGKVVIDTRGMRTKLEISSVWLPSEDLALLKAMINSERILTVSYPDVDGDKNERFIFDPISLKAFRYGVQGVDIWYAVTIRAQAQTITRYSV